MPARAISSATISFGLVSIPIKVYSTNAAETGIRFNMLHEACGTRLKQQYICPKDEVVVPRSETVKGYEFAKGQYVTFTDQELKALEEEASRSVDISEFVPLSEVDPLYYEKTYYVGPDKGGERAYRLLRAAMRETERAAVAKFAARGKQYVVLIRPFEDGLVMQQLRYADEIRSFEDVPLGEGEAKPEEIQLAVQLIEQIASSEFRPERYEDDVKKRIEEAIEQKMAGHEITTDVVEEPRAQIVDIMEALKKSLGSKGTTSQPAARTPARGTREKRLGGKRMAAKTARATATEPKKKAARSAKKTKKAKKRTAAKQSG